MRSKKCISLLAILSTVFLAASNFGCASGQSASPPTNPAQISVSITPLAAQSVDEGQSINFIATVANDSSDKGVSWAVSCSAAQCGSVSPATTASGATTKYTAPNSVAANLTVSVTATSAADSTKSAPGSVTVMALFVSVSPSTPQTVDPGQSLNLTATVANDSANKGVTWTVSCPTAPCGTVSPTPTLSGVATTYTAPANPLSNDLAVTITATSVADPAKSASANIAVPAIMVSVSPPSVTVQAGGTRSLTATVSNDPSNKGVTWSISPASGAGTLSNVTSTSVAYNAPANPPASNLAVTLTATSVADPSKSASANITVPAITVSAISPRSALIPINATQQFTATVQFDPANKGIAWAPAQGGVPCSPACGTFSPATTPSGTPSTYTAPAAVPANPSVTITATSVSDTTKSNTAPITLTNGTVKLVPASLNFGNVKRNLRRSLTVSLTNTGNTTLTISSMTATPSFSQSNNCTASVGAGISCTITVTFAPGSIGGFSGTLTINDSSADSPQKVPLSGSGTRFIAGAVPSALAVERAVAVPTPTGPSKVGTRVMDLVDATREDPFLADGTKRELLVRFWYPASLQQDCMPAEYTSPAVWSYFSQLTGVPLPEVKTNSCQDAAIAGGAHPVVVFTHGYTGTFTDYTFLFEDLASRGYVVASVDHTYEATAVEFPDGRFVESFFGSHLGSTLRTDEDAYTSAVTARLSDLNFVVEELARMNARADSPFAGKLDMSRIALAGHSLGGLTALVGVERQPRFKAGILIDSVAPDRLVHATETPVLMLITGREQWSVEECNLWNNLQGPRLAVNLPDAEHLVPSDLIWLAKGVVKTGALGPEKTMAVLRNYIAAFLDTNLRGQPMDSLLAGPSPDCPHVGVTTQTQSLRGKD